ncbi:hypothetical protein [Kiloniella sp. EL199]|uniref:hypothetical protein n=1 Tax=Kiloniella sp. EL199 TaxID=2107581 RepID=UPI0013C45244|nr:hypothetical protein [Kiloniella sp. EL199]
MGDTHTAMGRLISRPVSDAAEAVLKGEIVSGVFAKPSDVKVAKQWLENLRAIGEKMMIVDYLV